MCNWSSTDPSCNRTTDSDTALAAAQAQIFPWPQCSTSHPEEYGPGGSPQKPTWSHVTDQTTWASTEPSGVTEPTDIAANLGHCRGMNPDMALNSSPGTDHTMASGDRAGNPNPHCPSSGTVLEHQHGHRLWPRLRASPWPLVTIWPTRHQHRHRLSCGRTSDPDMVLSSNPGLDITMVPGGNTGHPDWHGPCDSVTLGHRHGPRWQPRPQPLHCCHW